MKGDREACLAAGMDEYIAKPVRRQALFGTIAKLHLRPVAEPALIANAEEEEIAEKVDAGADLPVLDMAALDDLKTLEDEGYFSLSEVVGIFVEEGPQRIAVMRRAVEEKEAVDLQREAHTLKGGSRDLGAQRLVEVCQELEEKGKIASLDGTSELIDRVEHEFALARDALLD
jgi:HPt (histidine-containing phosphotransfer) domain-containing protein